MILSFFVFFTATTSFTSPGSASAQSPTNTRTPTPINIGNFVWDDLDQDGTQDAGEPGLAGVSVQLWKAAKYQLINTPTPTRTPTPINIGNFVWDDLDQDGTQDAGEPGLAGVSVQLWNAAKNQLINSTSTSASGAYTLVAPIPGNYRVRVVLPSALDAFSPKDAALNDQTDSDINPSGVDLGFTDTFNIASNVISTTIYDAGIIKFRTPTPTRTPTPINIGNLVWHDLNGNGIQDAGEPGIAGMTVQLWNAAKNNLIFSAVTNANGNYTVIAPVPGDYRVRVVPFSGSSFSPKNQGADDTKDSDINASILSADYGFSDIFTIANNVISTTIYDAGLSIVGPTPPPGIITTGVFRPSNGAIYLKKTNTSGFADSQLNYGTGGDYPVAGDWDGNGTATIGIYRNGVFYLRNSNTIGFADFVIPFGAPGDQPVVGDWDGNGIDTIGIYRYGTFYLRNSNSAGAPDISFSLGNPGDVGIAGDFNGDGLDTTGVFRPSNGVIFLKNFNTSGFADVALNYGLAGDKPVIGDWDGNGTDTIGIYRNATFYLRNSNTNGFADLVFALGNPGDMPIAGNWGLP